MERELGKEGKGLKEDEIEIECEDYYQQGVVVEVADDYHVEK